MIRGFRAISRAVTTVAVSAGLVCAAATGASAMEVVEAEQPPATVTATDPVPDVPVEDVPDVPVDAPVPDVPVDAPVPDVPVPDVPVPDLPVPLPTDGLVDTVLGAIDGVVAAILGLLGGAPVPVPAV